MSDGPPLGVQDFDRSQVLAAIQPLIGAKSIATATAAITVFGEDSPYFDDDSAPQWLAGIRKDAIPGLLPRRPPVTPLTVEAALIVARSGISVLASTAALRTAMLESRNQSAIFAGGIVRERARALLRDPAAGVRTAAALSLLSFAPDQAAQVMKANLASAFGPLFVNALARGNPQPYLPMLAQGMEQPKVIDLRLQSAKSWVGASPATDSWHIMFHYIRERPAAELASGKLDPWLGALEGVQWLGSSEPQELYALYLSRGLISRAQHLRDSMRKSPIYIDSMFDRVQQNPAAYLQQ